jgi:hypothetical protein
MLYRCQHEVNKNTAAQVGEECIYRDCVREIVSKMPTEDLKKMFKLEIWDPDNTLNILGDETYYRMVESAKIIFEMLREKRCIRYEVTLNI